MDLKMSELSEIRKLYDKLPHTECEAGCFRCCVNSIQMSQSEREAIGGYDWKGRCPKLGEDGRCTVYDSRPLVCRLYGASELLSCEGCKCAEPLTEEETLDILRRYRAAAGKLS